MRIGVNTLFLVPGDVGGTEIYLRQNLLEMARLFPDQTLVLFTTLDNDEVLRRDLEQFQNVEFAQLKFKAAFRPMRIIAEQTLLPYKAWRADIDVMWSPGYTAPVFSTCRQVVTIHDLQYLSHPEDMSWLELKTLDLLVRSACRRCDHLITVSDFSRKEIVAHGFAKEAKVAVIPEGVDPSFGIVREPEISGLKDVIHSNQPYILCIAHTYPHKQVHLLVEAYGLIQDRIPHHLVHIGKARRGEKKVAKALESVGDASKVHRIMGLEFNDLVTVYQQADLFVLPSVYEGFGLPVLEAMLAGTPVITTSCASLPEVGGECVTYVKDIRGQGFAAAILDSLECPYQVRKTVINNAVKRAIQFSWSSSATATMQILATMDNKNEVN
jgi:glycosyltransferase involved in cell wall biosynthesis